MITISNRIQQAKRLPKESSGYSILSRMEEMKLNQEIGLRIAQARAQMGLSQREFAIRLGVSQGLVGAWESHKKPPGRKTLQKISEVTGISMDALAGSGALEVQALQITDPDEIRLIMDFRRLPSLGKENTLKIIEMALNFSGVNQKKRRPAEVK